MNPFVKAIKEYFKDAPAIKVDKVYDGGVKYLFMIRNELYNDPDPLDPWYTIDKKSHVVKGFLPHMDLKWFNGTLKHEVKTFI